VVKYVKPTQNKATMQIAAALQLHKNTGEIRRADGI